MQAIFSSSSSASSSSQADPSNSTTLILPKKGHFQIKAERIGDSESLIYDLYKDAKKIFSSSAPIHLIDGDKIINVSAVKESPVLTNPDAKQKEANKISIDISKPINFTDSDLLAFLKGKITTTDDITHIDLSYYIKHFQDVAPLLKQFPNLTSIEPLSCDESCEQKIAIIAQHCQNLTRISLKGYAYLSNLMIESLAKQCSKLTSVHLSGCSKITNVAIQALLTHCHKLTSIHLDNCTQVDNAGIHRMAANYPDVHIHLNIQAPLLRSTLQLPGMQEFD